jgi:uncharacterized SAM-binding protein YcdF (DUF218 family)
LQAGGPTSILKAVLRAYRVGRNVLAMIGLCWLLVTLTPVTKWYAAELAGTWYEPDGDVLIVLGADTPTGDFIGLASYWRCIYAVRFWRNGNFRSVVISGGAGIADSMKKFVQFEGVPAEKLVVDNRASSTRENALFIAPILARMPGRKVLVTSDFHTYRSVRVFRKLGIDVTPRFFPYAAKRYNTRLERWSVFLDLCLESLKIVGYRVRGWI